LICNKYKTHLKHLIKLEYTSIDIYVYIHFKKKEVN